jgi:RNA polymerase sigma-70 factor (ECF subfamily)
MQCERGRGHGTAIHVKAVSKPLPGCVVNNDWAATDTPDAQLVSAAQRDPTKFVALYERYFGRVYGYVYLRVGNPAVCEDITSQVFITALARVRTLRPEGNVKAWLLTVAQNAVNDIYRQPDRFPDRESTTGVLPDPEPGPEDQVLAMERAMELRALLATLRPDQQDLLALRYGADLSFPEIARIVGKNPVAVRVRVHRILAGLRRRYSRDT